MLQRPGCGPPALVCCAAGARHRPDVSPPPRRRRRYNPQDVSRAATLLQAGACLARRFQPYESHIPFLLQIKVCVGGGRASACVAHARLACGGGGQARATQPSAVQHPPRAQIDFNLLGMGHIELARVLFRDPLPSSAQLPSLPAGAGAGAAPATPATPAQGGGAASYWRAEGALLPPSPPPPPPTTPGVAAALQGQPGPAATPGTPRSSQAPPRVLWTAEGAPPEWCWATAVAEPGSALPRVPPARQSCCALELDACVDDILNRWGAVRPHPRRLRCRPRS